MQVPNHFKALLFALSTSLPIAAHAQSISSEEKSTAIQKIAKHVATNYVYPEKGGQIASHIQMANHRGEFNKAGTWKEFDELVTESIQNFSNDKHLYVKNDPDQVKSIKGESRNSNRMYVVQENVSFAEDVVAESKILPNNIGYLKFSHLYINTTTLDRIKDAMRSVENTDALIIDLRNNAGGGSEMGAVLESYFLPSGTPLLEFTSRNGEIQKLSTVNWLQEKKYEKPVFILANKKTASAAEAFAFVLQNHKRATVVGEKSAGASFMNEWFALDDQNYVSVSTSAPHLPGTDITWEGEGVKPDIKVKNGDALQVALERLN